MLTDFIFKELPSRVGQFFFLTEGISKMPSIFLYLQLMIKKLQASLSPQTKSWLVLIFLSLIWGTSYILIKKGLEVYTPYQLGLLRLGISALAFLPFLVRRFSQIDWSRWKPLLLVGITGTGLPSMLFPLAQTEISSSVAGILNSLTPLFTLILGIIIFGSSFVWSKLLGVLLGLVGAAMLILFGNEVGLEGNMWYGLLIVFATICYATSANTVGKQLRGMRSLMISAVAFGMVGIPALLGLFATDFTHRLLHYEGGWLALGYIVILALASTVFASIVFFRLVQITSPVFSSMVSYLVPVVALFWGLVDGEAITILHFLGMALILAGVYLSRK